MLEKSKQQNISIYDAIINITRNVLKKIHDFQLEIICVVYIIRAPPIGGLPCSP